ncbi:MAG TPA: hypothetical protein VG637_07025, partial [Actinomycetes bacterium]|nr:hypothetical protein [Actinomycetes bacterium]
MSIAARPADHTWPPSWLGILAWSVAGATVLSLVPSVWLLSQVSFEGSSEAAPAPMTVGPVALAVVSSAAVGALLAGRRPRHPVGWLLLVGGYAAVVLGLGQLLGRDSSLVVAAATLAVAG